MISRYIKAGICGMTFVALVSAFPGSGFGSSRERVGQSYIELPAPLKKGTVRSLKDYLKKQLATKYVGASKLYDPPLEGLEDKLYISVKRERVLPIIAGGVSSFAGDEEGLAAALFDGTVRIWSGLNCRKLQLPGGGGAEKLGYGPGSTSLAAASAQGDRIYVYDLEKCERIPGDIPVEHDPVKMMAVSRTGDWMGMIDSFNTLFCGPVKGPLSEISVLEGTPVYLGFTPAQGILIAVEASGNILKIGMKNMSRLDSDHVPGGPFREVRMAGYVVCLTADDGQEVYWDLRRRAVVRKADALRDQPSWIYEQGDALVYSTGMDRWLIDEHLGMPMLIISCSVKEKLLRVRDLDRETRYYSILDGKECPEVPADDWKVLTPKKGICRVGKMRFRLYDPVYQKGTQLLYCRYIEGRGFYLWWDQDGRYANINPHPMSLPVRKNIMAEKPAVWVPLIQDEIR